MQSTQLTLPFGPVTVTAESGITPHLRLEEPEPGLFLIHLVLENGGAEFRIPPHTWSFSRPIVDIHGLWHAEAKRETVAYLPESSSRYFSQATAGSPMFTLFSHDDASRLTAALADTAREVLFELAVSEERAEIDCRLARFDRGQVETATVFTDTLRLDFRAQHYSKATGSVSAWWESLPGMQPAPVPAGAREAVLSTWYSMHQQLTPELIEQECRLSHDLGCRVVIVDDGWQTADNGRGYGYCGDWEIDEGKMPGMPAHVARVQAMGLQYMLWIAPLFMGVHMKNFARFEDKFLFQHERMGIGVLDARFPEVRAYLVETFVRLMRELNLDGYKIDFVDMVGGAPPAMYAENGDGRDIQSIPQAMDALLVEMTTAFRRFKPDFLIEFRQSYVGPLMRKYGNMFRAGDCPNDFERNRYRAIAIRLLSGTTPAHADMFMWHPQDTAANAARQMLAALFAVPQISVWLDRIPADHRRTLTHWLAFWQQHRDVLLDGALTPHKPHLGFPSIEARTATKQIITVYDETIVRLGEAPPAELLVVNAGYTPRIILDCAGDFGSRVVTYYDLDGVKVEEETVELRGVVSVGVPVCGYAVIL